MPSLEGNVLGLRRLGIEGRFLRSRVARRIFISVVLCALLPISAFALLSWKQVTSQLSQHASERLALDAKQQGMMLLERLLLLDTSLRLIAASLSSEGAPGARSELPREARGLAAGRFEEISVGAWPVASGAGDPLLAAFSAPDRQVLAHLEGGGPWLRVLPGAPPAIALGRLLDGATGPRLVAARIDPSFLFVLDGLGSEEGLIVLGENDTPIFSSVPIAGTVEIANQIGDWPAALDDEDRVSGSWGLFLRPTFRAPAWTLLVAEPSRVVLAPLRQFEAVFPLVSVLSLLVMGLSALILVRRSLVPIEILHAATQRIADRDFETRVSIETNDEFQDLGRSFNEMAESIAHHVRVVETVNTVGSALSSELDREKLLDAILRGAMNVTGARAGAIHLMDGDDRLRRMRLVGSEGVDASSLASHLDRQASRALRTDAPIESPGDGTLSIPMRNHEHECIGVIQLVAGAGRNLERPARALAESLASQTAVTLTRDRLAGEFRGLFEGLIELLVTAIDEKSPYTGAHCRRVPVLTEMLADAACATQEGPLREFTLSEAERYELRIAALLHDCGKVTTPVHVQDKATKLEALFDRIAVVDLRFEIVLRDLEISRLGGSEPGPGVSEAIRELQDDREFLRRCNIGGEFMAPADRERVQRVARRWRWRGPGGIEQPILSDEEVENLCVVRGTLNDRERDLINHHVVTTIQMLEQLPYPKSLRNVPFIAGCHHERMDGCGYPKGLTREQMSTQARILGLADVFEALTAKDRPYKPGMKLRTVLSILEKMRDEGHIDGEILEVFVREKVHLRYAAEWLDPEQIDDDLLDEAAPFLARSAHCEAHGPREPGGSRADRPLPAHDRE